MSIRCGECLVLEKAKVSNNRMKERRPTAEKKVESLTAVMDNVVTKMKP